MALFVLLGVASGMWIQLSLLAVTVGIFYATITLKKSARPADRGKVIALGHLGIDSVEDLDEVA